MKYALLGMCLLLTACQSQEEKKAAFIDFCAGNEFSVKQCEVLYLIAKASSDASDAAANANAMSSVAMGVSAAQGVRR